MQRSDLRELHCIMPMINLESVQRLGILSHARAEKVPHRSIADQDVQARRANRKIPNGRRLHEYANLYIDARNPMMYRRRGMHLDFCVLRVHTDALDIEGTIIADGNAASDWTAFYSSPTGLAAIDRDLVLAYSWTGENQLERSRKRCAEVLVPDRVSPEYLIGSYVSCGEALARYQAIGLTLPGLQATILEHMFFR